MSGSIYLYGFEVGWRTENSNIYVRMRCEEGGLTGRAATVADESIIMENDTCHGPVELAGSRGNQASFQYTGQGMAFPRALGAADKGTRRLSHIEKESRVLFQSCLFWIRRGSCHFLDTSQEAVLGWPCSGLVESRGRKYGT